jgi:hypothetical protein
LKAFGWQRSSALFGSLGVKWLHGPYDLGAVTFRALDFFLVMLIDRHRNGELMAALPANVFVEWHINFL